MNTVLLMPEAYLALGCLSALVALGGLWHPLFFLAPALALAAGTLAARAVSAAAGARFPTPGLTARERTTRQVIAALLHLAQPLVRLDGRLRHGLTPWRRRGAHGRAVPVARRLEHWSEEWVDPPERVRSLEASLVDHGAVVRRGGDFDDWDLETRGGTLAGTRVWTVVEEHGGGQLTRLRCRPTWSRGGLVVILLLAVLGLGAAASGAAPAAAVIGILAAALALRTVSEGSSAMGLTVRAASPAAAPADPRR